jgi:hypothetical protein
MSLAPPGEYLGGSSLSRSSATILTFVLVSFIPVVPDPLYSGGDVVDDRNVS